MPARLVRHGIVALAALLAVVAAIVACLPLIASTQIVRDRIAQELGIWSGYRVQLVEAPDIEVWPSFTATLRNVSFSRWESPSGGEAMHVEQIDIDLSAWSALSGDVAFSRVRLARPSLAVEPAPGGIFLPAAPSGGRFRFALEAAMRALRDNPTTPDLSGLPDQAVGIVEFSEGQVVTHAAGGDVELVTSLDGRISWTNLNRGATISASGIWRGEAVQVDATSAQPLVLIAGGAAPLKIEVKATPLTIAYDGIANLSESPFVDGTISLSSPSLRRALEWAKTRVSPGEAIGAASISGRVTGDRQRIKLDNAEIALGDNPGVGVLEFTPSAATPGVTGTLDFETLDLLAVLSSFSASATPAARKEPIDTDFASQVAVDLRLSAKRAIAGAVTLSNVAATVQVKDALAAFDISDATAFGGTIQTGFRIDRKFSGNAGEVRLLATDVDAALVAVAAGWKRVSPKARANISVILKGPVQSWMSMLSSAEGSASIKLGGGTISGIDVGALIERTRDGGFFALDEVPTGTMPIDGAELKAVFSGGVARFEKSWIKGRAMTLALDGVLPLIGQGLALSATLKPPAPSTPNAASLSGTTFFVGGSWHAPFVSPVFPDAHLE